MLASMANLGHNLSYRAALELPFLFIGTLESSKARCSAPALQQHVAMPAMHHLTGITLARAFMKAPWLQAISSHHTLLKARIRASFVSKVRRMQRHESDRVSAIC